VCHNRTENLCQSQTKQREELSSATPIDDGDGDGNDDEEYIEKNGKNYCDGNHCWMLYYGHCHTHFMLPYIYTKRYFS
jgi:hypothetical protein